MTQVCGASCGFCQGPAQLNGPRKRFLISTRCNKILSQIHFQSVSTFHRTAPPGQLPATVVATQVTCGKIARFPATPVYLSTWIRVCGTVVEAPLWAEPVWLENHPKWHWLWIVETRRNIRRRRPESVGKSSDGREWCEQNNLIKLSYFQSMYRKQFFAPAFQNITSAAWWFD